MGDFTARFHRPESGIHTVEGNVAGAKAAFLSQKRQRQQEEFEERKRQIITTATTTTTSSSSSSFMASKFASATTSQREEMMASAKTVGLVTAQDFAAAVGGSGTQPQQGKDVTAMQQLEQLQMAKEEEAERKQQQLEEDKKRKKKLKAKKKMMATLSFAYEEEDLLQVDDLDSNSNSKKQEQQQQKEVDGNPSLLIKSTTNTTTTTKKDPTVDTSFLPDKARDEAMEAERRRLEVEWKQRQEIMKQEQLEIVYSYWDGSGHRRSVIVKKGDSIGDFLERVRQDLSREFRELQNISATDHALLYVKEDLILPLDLTFYDLIVTKARGKSGPLFHFDVHDDVRVGQALDVRIEKDESHPGKVIERRWYERNKHIFPASRWEVYDPNKDYGQYTIHGGEVVSKNNNNNNKKK